MRTHKHAELIKAWADNPDLEIQGSCVLGEWIDINSETFLGLIDDNRLLFRIKPPKIERWHKKPTLKQMP